MKITKKRENILFILVGLIFLVISANKNWDDIKKGAKDGYEDAKRTESIK
ncbi:MULTISPECIES: hypothetical protein [Flavobacterium]|uniref:YtxH domain-containing protein n=1 Tax=Flavobacterium jumunjinense TaxID=998845 RepID=A0ABV5GTN4_9FLAO|nr:MULTISPECIES: hypothetical protein [Flavobacterium]